MRIVFNGFNSGLGNNGGSRTIILASQVLESLGHQCEIAARVDNFSWFDHKPVINYVYDDFDVIINIAAIDYNLTKNSPVKNKFAWWRGHENWAHSEEYLIACYKDKSVNHLVNSKGLQRRLESVGTKSKVIYQGIDFSKWCNRSLRDKSVVRIGCLFHKKSTKRWKDFVSLSKLLGYKKYQYVGFGLSACHDDFLDVYLTNPSHESLIDLYSSCDLWFAPTISEGLHNPPMEASLCGARVVCSNNVNNGMVLDYADESTALIYPHNDIETAAKLIENYDPQDHKVVNMNHRLKRFIGSREDNMKKFIELARFS